MVAYGTKGGRLIIQVPIDDVDTRAIKIIDYFNTLNERGWFRAYAAIDVESNTVITLDVQDDGSEFIAREMYALSAISYMSTPDVLIRLMLRNFVRFLYVDDYIDVTLTQAARDLRDEIQGRKEGEK